MKKRLLAILVISISILLIFLLIKFIPIYINQKYPKSCYTVIKVDSEKQIFVEAVDENIGTEVIYYYLNLENVDIKDINGNKIDVFQPERGDKIEVTQKSIREYEYDWHQINHVIHIKVISKGNLVNYYNDKKIQW